MTEGRDIVEPVYWPQRDDRREPVLDPNYDPPCVIRYVGWRPCSCCGKKFFSRDVAGIRLCGPCKDGTRRESW